MVFPSVRVMVFFVLIGCAAGGPPPLDRSSLPPVEKTEDWDDWGTTAANPSAGERRQLKGNEIRGRLVGNLLSGCYPAGQNFSEILSDDGKVLDPRDGQELGRYQVRGDRLCFTYPNRSPSCYNVTADEAGLYFSKRGEGVVASTACPM
ncbi:MAG: hypothetical protein AAGG79_08010 [Pseudomonadota bacterium]